MQEGAALSNLEFLFVDLGITTTLAVTLGRTGPAPGLTHRRPVGSLVSLSNLVPLGLQVVLCFSVQWSALKLLQVQPWSVLIEKICLVFFSCVLIVSLFYVLHTLQVWACCTDRKRWWRGCCRLLGKYSCLLCKLLSVPCLSCGIFQGSAFQTAILYQL